MRFQPIIVPKPSARATETLTQVGMYFVSLSASVLYLEQACWAFGSVNPWVFASLPMDSPTRYRFVRRDRRSSSGRSEKVFTLSSLAEIVSFSAAIAGTVFGVCLPLVLLNAEP